MSPAAATCTVNVLEQNTEQAHSAVSHFGKEHLLNAYNIDSLSRHFFLLHTMPLDDLSIQTEGQQFIIHVYVISTTYSCVYVCVGNREGECVCFFQGQVIRHQIKAATILVSSAYKWQNNPCLIIENKTWGERSDYWWLSVCEAQTQGQQFIYTWNLTTVRPIPVIFVLF